VISNTEQIRKQISEAKASGGDVTHLVMRLIEIEKKPKKTKIPRVTTP